MKADDKGFLEALRMGRPFPLRVRGLSMGMTISDGEYVWITRVNPGDLGLGNIVLHRGNGERSLTLHRIVFKRKGPEGMEYITKGDSHINLDGWIGEEDILGKVSRVEKEGYSIDLLSRRGQLYDILLFLYSHVLIPLNVISLMFKPWIEETNKGLAIRLGRLKRNIVSFIPWVLSNVLSPRIMR